MHPQSYSAIVNVFACFAIHLVLDAGDVAISLRVRNVQGPRWRSIIIVDHLADGNISVHGGRSTRAGSRDASIILFGERAAAVTEVSVMVVLSRAGA